MYLANKNKCNICNKKLKSLPTELILKFLSKKIKINYAKCDDCDYAQTINIPSSKVLKQYYRNNNQFRRKKIVTQEEKYHIKKQIIFLRKYCPNKNIKILEIGPDMGHFLSTLNKNFKKNKFFYSELNEYANRYLKSLGFTEHKKQKVNCIILLHVFEHVPNPVKFLKYIKKFLLEDGIIFMEVPDYSVKDKINCDPFQFEHLSYFSLSTLTNISKRAGLIIESVERDITKNYSTTPGRVIRLIMRKYDKKYLKSTWNTIAKQNTNNFLKINHLIKKLVKKNSKVAIYGAGTVTQQINSQFKLNGLIEKVYDKDQKKTGKKLFNRPIINSDKLNDKDFDKIIVLVIGYKKEVIKYLLSKNVKKSKIIAPF